MPAQPYSLPQNNNPLNLAAHKWLREARASAPPHDLHLLSLAHWGLENGAEGEWPDRDRPAVESQLASLFGWKAENVLAWLLSNPNGPESRSEQAQSLLQALKWADDPKSAAAVVLSEIYSRQQADNPALQPAASGLQ
jgi:hypothetical protein